MSGVEYLSQVTECALLVEDLVGLGELLSVLSGRAGGLVDFAEPLDLVEEAFACTLAIFTVEVVLLVRALLQVIAHHHGVLQQQEVRGSAVLLYLGQGARGCCRGADGDQLGELEFVLIGHVLPLLPVKQALLATLMISNLREGG